MKVLVTGANGLLGSHLVAELLTQGHKVKITVRKDQFNELKNLEHELKSKDLKLTDIEIEPIDMEIYEDVRNSITPDIDTIVHCAAKVDMVGSDMEMVRTNFELTHFMCQACLESPSNPRFVHISSIATISSSSDESSPATEHNMFEGMTSASAYGRSKFLSEMEVRRAMALGLRASIVCPSVILGTTANPKPKGMDKILRTLLHTNTLLCTKGGNGFVYVEDVARAIILISQAPQSIGQRYIINGENNSFLDLVSYTNQINGHSAPRITINRGVIDFALKAVKLFGANELNDNLVNTLCNRNYWCSNKFIQEVAPDFKFTSTQKTIEIINNKIKRN